MSTLREAAKQLWLQGFNVVPFRYSHEGGEVKKRPLVDSWQKWQTQRQTLEEFESLSWNEADAFGVIANMPNNEGLYIACVDYDTKHVSEEAKTEGKKLLKKFPVTRMESTVNNGIHLIYLSKVKPQPIKNFHESHALELIAGPQIVLLSQSKGYKALNDNSPTIVENVESIFYEVLGVPDKRQPIIEASKRRRKAKRVKGVRPCIKRALETNRNLPHLMRLAIAAEYKRAGLSDEDVARLFEGQDDYNFETSLYQTRTAEPSKAASCQSIREWGFCLGFECPHAPKNVEEVLTEDEKARAHELLKQDLISLAVKYGRRKIIGEDNVLICNFVALCSGQTKYPFSLILTGFSGSGKNESLRAIKPLIPPEWVFEFTTATPEAVKYIPEEFHGTLLIYEAAGVQSKTGSLGLRAIGRGSLLKLFIQCVMRLRAV